MKRLSALAFVAVCAAVAAFGVLVVGCEKADGPEGLRVDPSSVVLEGGSNSVVFTVSIPTNGGRAFPLPLRWSVSDSSLGSIARSSGESAVYFRSDRDGDNIIVVKDEYDREGFATVKQR